MAFIGHPTVGPEAGIGKPTGAANLVTNGGFETNTTGWVGTRATVARDTGAAKFGSACMSITDTGGFSYSRYTFSGLADGTYTLSVWEQQGAQAATDAVINVGDGTSALFDSGSFAGAASWNRRTGTFTVSGSPASVFIDLYARSAGGTLGDQMLYDGVQVEIGSVATPYIETDGLAATRQPLKVVGP